MSFENYEANGHMHDLELAIILHKVQCVSHPRRSGCRDENVHLRPAYTWNVQLRHQLLLCYVFRNLCLFVSLCLPALNAT